MLRKLTYTMMLGLCLLLLGCGDDEKKADNAAAPAAPPPPAGGNQGDGNTAAANLVAAEGALAPHARGLSIVTPDHFAVIKVDLASARKAPLVQSVPQEMVAGAAGGLPIGPGPGGAAEMATMAEKVDLVWVAIGPPGKSFPKEVPVSFAVYVRAVDAQAIDDFIKDLKLPGEIKTVAYNGQQYKRFEDAGLAGYILQQDKEVVFTTDEAVVKQVIDAGGKIAKSPILDKLAQSNVDADVVLAGSLGPFKQPAADNLAALIKDSMAMLKATGLPVPPLEQTAGPLPAQIDYATIAIDLEDPLLIDIDADMDSPQAAENFKVTLEGLLSLGNIMLGGVEKDAPDDPSVKEMFAAIHKIMKAVKVEVNGQRFDASLAHLPEMDKMSELVAAAASAPPRLDEIANGRQIGLAGFNHETATRRWPENIKDADGNDLLSWRVAILPYMEENLLYQQVDRKAAWDSEANRELLDIELQAYRTAAVDDFRMTTWKMLPDAPGGMAYIATGVGTEVPWAKPDNFTIDPKNPEATLGPEPEGGYVVVMRDASATRMTTEEIVAKLPPAETTEPDTGSGTTTDPAPTTEPEPDPDPSPVDPGGVFGADDPEPAPPAKEPRTWTSKDGKFSVEATFVKVIGDKVTIRFKSNGVEKAIEIDKLSEADKQYIKSLRK